MIIKTHWEDYRRKVIHKDASLDQINQLKMAFYAGCMQIISINEAIGEPNISEEVGIKILEAIRQELKEYRESLD